MKNDCGFRAVLALLLALALLLPAGAAAADGLYPEEQFYREKREQTQVYSVQVYATSVYSGAERQRDRMLGLGYDSYIYQKESNGLYFVLCGKFTERDDAEALCAAILADRERKDAYVTRAYLPAEAVQAFRAAQDNRDTANIVFLPAQLSLEPYSFAPWQYYDQNETLTPVYTVQIATSRSADGAQNLRDRMLAAGYDSFLYVNNGVYRVMCGKFRSYYDALAYGEYIHMDQGLDQAFVNNAWLPEGVIAEFEALFYSRVSIHEDYRMVETWWEAPSGPFFRSDEPDTVPVYTVQLAQGTSFLDSEQARDRLTDRGYPAFVYKDSLRYKIMTGMFYDEAEAKQYCAEIRSAADEKGAVVRIANLPADEVERFLAWRNGTNE